MKEEDDLSANALTLINKKEDGESERAKEMKDTEDVPERLWLLPL